MSEKTIKSRIVHKHDTESNWILATNFTPKQGELIVYDIDDNYSYERIKIGDGAQNVNDLPFTDDTLREYVDNSIIAATEVYVGPDRPTDPNIKVWINTAEEGTGVVPVLPRISTINLPLSSWSGSASPYYQEVSINTVTSATKIELNPTVNQIVSLQNDDIALMAENDAGYVKVYSFGGKPSSDMTMQVTLMEVSYV